MGADNWVSLSRPFVSACMPRQINIPKPSLTSEEEAALAEGVHQLFTFGAADNPAGLISFHRYLALLTLMAIPHTRMELAFYMFDSDGSGEIDASEYAQMLEGSLISAEDYDEEEEDDDMLGYLFGPKKEGGLTLHRFKEFVEELQMRVTRVSFDLHAPRREDDTISGRDLAYSIVGHASSHHVDALLAHVHQMEMASPAVARCRISFAEYNDLLEVVKRMDDVDQAIRLYASAQGTLTRDYVRRAALAVADRHLSDRVLDVLGYLFERNGATALNRVECLDVMRNWQFLKFHIRVGTSVGALTNCVKHCASDWYEGVGGGQHE